MENRRDCFAKIGNVSHYDIQTLKVSGVEE